MDRLLDARDRLNVSPLGAGALAGTSLPIDPEATARWLGFAAPLANSLDAVSDRDFVAETLFDIALLGVHLSRMGEELVLWTSAEFFFATLGDAFTTGSSMLPQKKNSDVAELARGKTGRLVGNLTGLLVMLKGLPLSYNRDLQEDKEPLLDSLRQVNLVLRALSGAYGSLEFHVEAAAAAADDEFLVGRRPRREPRRGGRALSPGPRARRRLGGRVTGDGTAFSQVVAGHDDTGAARRALRAWGGAGVVAARRGRRAPRPPRPAPSPGRGDRRGALAGLARTGAARGVASSLLTLNSHRRDGGRSFAPVQTALIR